jgi:hypothetical protein
VIQVKKPDFVRVIDGDKGISFSLEDSSVVAKFNRRVKWYQLQITNPAEGNDCPNPDRSFFTTADRKSIELGISPYPHCIWEVHIQWKD